MSTTKNDGGPAKVCAWCSSVAARKQGRIWLCQMHYRFGSMRTRAKRDGKPVPNYAELAALASLGMTCSGCDLVMTWDRSLGASRQATLQHDRDGGYRFLCLGCNTRHSVHPSDTFYSIPKGHKYCPDCAKVLPEDLFCIDRSRPRGRKSYCRPCSSIRNIQWRNNHVFA